MKIITVVGTRPELIYSIEHLLNIRGSEIGMKYAEGFETIRSIF